jgi:hypothetical protein
VHKGAAILDGTLVPRIGRVDRERVLDQAEIMEGSRRELVRGAQEAMGPWLAGLRPWSLWGTLTVDPKRLPQDPVWVGKVFKDEPYKAMRLYRPVSMDKALWMVKRSMAGAARSLRTRLDWVAGVEPQKSGLLHAHCLVYSGQAGPVRSDAWAMWRSWYELAGYCKFEPPRSVMDCAVYSSKYVCKPGAWLVFSPHLHEGG